MNSKRKCKLLLNLTDFGQVSADIREIHSHAISKGTNAGAIGRSMLLKGP